MKHYVGMNGCCIAVSCCFLFLCVGRVNSAQICGKYPRPDPCLPGGVWDPVLERCTGPDGNPCFQCYSGQFCKEKEDVLTCKLAAGAGSPVFQAEYWLNGSVSGDPCTTTLGHYRPTYQMSDLGGEDNLLPPLLDAIHTLHTKIGNAEVEGYHLVSGMGAMMVLNLAVSALSKKILANCTHDCPRQVDVFAQRPYYGAFANLLDFSTAQWNPDADPASPWTIEIHTYPNNPDGVKKAPLVTDPDHIITDMVYYWPMYTDIDKKMNASLMIFSSSKHDGLAGTRFGWALVKDPDLARDMWNIVFSMVIATSIDIELRILTSLRAILGEGEGSDGMYPFHKFGRDKIYSRFSKLRTALSGCPHLELQNPTSSPGAYAWIHCHGEETCEEIFDKVNLTGFNGKEFGTTAQDIRFSMLLSSVEARIFQEKFLSLCKQ